MSTIDREPEARAARLHAPSLQEIFWGPLATRIRRIAQWRKRGALGKAYGQARRAMKFEPLEPRLLLSADYVLGDGATAAIVDSFHDYSALVQEHIDDDSTDFATPVPGLLLTQRDTNNDGEIDDNDLVVPKMRDLLAVETTQTGAGGISTTLLNDLDTNDDTVVSWKEAFDGIVVGEIHDLLSSFVPADLNGDTHVDGDDVELWVALGLSSAFSGPSFPGSLYLTQWFDVDLTSISTAGGADFNLSFNATIGFVDSYQIDLGLAADAQEIELPEWQFEYSGTPGVEALNRDVSITGQVVAPMAVKYSGGGATFAATDTIVSSVKAGGDGTASLDGKIVNVGFLGTEAGGGSEFALSMTIETEIVDPSSPTRLGFADTDGDTTLAKKLAFEANSSGGTASTPGALTATSTPEAAFDLATPIRFDLTLEYETGDSGPVAVSVDVSSAGDAAAVRTALESAINGTSLHDLLTVTKSGGDLLGIHLVDSDATPLGFSNGTHFDNSGGAPYTLTAGTGFDFDTDNNGIEDGSDTPVHFAEAVFLMSLAGALPRIVTVAEDDYTSSDWLSAVQLALNNVGLGTVTAILDTSNLNSVKLTLSAGSSVEIVDTDTLSLKMTAVNAITQTEINQLTAADQRSRLFTSTTDTAGDNFAITLNLDVRDGLDFTPSGTPQLRIDASFDGYDGPFDLPASDPLFLADFSGHERFALPMDNTDFDQYLDFNVFGRAETIAMVQQLEGWMDRLAQNVALSGVDIPLAQAVLGDVLDFAGLVHDEFLVDDMGTDDTNDDVGKLLQKVIALDADGPSIIFFTAQEFGAALNKIGILELTGSGDFATYDAANKDILYHVNAAHQLPDVELPVDFTLPLPPLTGIYSESSVFLTAEGTFETILGLRMGEAGSIDGNTLLSTLNNSTGVDIAEGPAVTAALSVDPVYGRLIRDAHFSVVVDNDPPVLVTAFADDTADFASIDELRTYLESRLDAALGADVVNVIQEGDRLRLVAGGTVNRLSITAGTSDAAYSELGLQTGPATTVSFVTDPIASPSAGDGGHLTFKLNDGSDESVIVSNAAENVSVTDLVADINAAIATNSNLANKVIASRLGNQIVFSAIDKSIYTFRVTPDTTAEDFFGGTWPRNAWLTVTAPNAPDSETLASFGRLSNDFALQINGQTISLSVDETNGDESASDPFRDPNGSLADFVADLNAKISDSTLDGLVVAEVSGTRVLLRADDSSVTSLTVSIDPSDAGGAAEMGFLGTLTGGQLGVLSSKPVLHYFGPTGDATFEVALTGFNGEGNDTRTVTLSYLNALGSAADLLTNATVYDLASDVQRALNAAFESASNNPLMVGVDAGRLLFTVKHDNSETPEDESLGVTDFVITAQRSSASDARAIDELKLYDVNDDPLDATATLDADSADLLIQDRHGDYHRVELDGLTTVGEVIGAINAATGGDVLADIGPLGNGLKLTDMTGKAENPLVVRTVNGSNAAIDLGIYLGGTSTSDRTGAGTIPSTAGEIVGDTIGTLALIDRTFLRQVDGNTPILSADIVITADNPDTPETEQIELEANFGFVAVTATGGGELDGQVDISLVKGASGRTTLRDLFGAVSQDLNGDHAVDIQDFEEVVNAPDFALSGQFDLDVSVVPGGGVDDVINDATVGSLSIVVNDPGDPFATPAVAPDVQVEWTAGALGDLEQFQNIDFGDVLNGLKELADFLDSYAAFGFLNDEIPLLGVSFNELVDIAGRFRSAVVAIEQNPAGSAQLLEQKIREEFGLPAGVLQLSLADGDDGDMLAGDMLKLKFNLGGAFSESLPIAFGIPNGAIDGAPIDINLEGQADLHVTGSLTAMFTVGVDLNPGPGFAPVYLYTNENDTKIQASLSASANDLTFNAALGPVGVKIIDGGAMFDASIDFKSSDGSDSRVPLTDAFDSFDVVELAGSASAVLPVYFPTASTYIDDISVDAAFSGSAGSGLNVTTFNVDVPTDFELDFSSFSLFDNLGLLIDATDLFLSGAQDILDGQVLGFKMPLVGNQLSDAAQFIEDFRSGFIHDLRNLVENAPELAASTVQGFLFDLLGPSGVNLLADTNGQDGITIDDVIIEGESTLTDGDASNDYLQWNILLGKHIPVADVNVDFDLGFPALGLDGDFGLNVAVDWELGIGLGISIADGAYIDVRREDYTPEDKGILPELELSFDVSLAKTSGISGDLLFLQLDINEATFNDINNNGVQDPGEESYDLNGDDIANDETHFHAGFSVDLTNNGDASKERLAFSDIGNLQFDLDLDADAEVNLDLTLKFNEDLVPETSGAAALLPQIDAHFALYWAVSDLTSGDVDLGAGLQYVAFEHVALDLGSFLGDLIVPIVEKIQDVTEPFQPIIDIVTAAIPVLSDLAGEPVTLVDIAAAFGEFNPDLIYAIADLVSLVNAIPTDVGSLIIDFGNFVIYDGGSVFGGVTGSNLADPNYNFLGGGGTDPIGDALTALESGLPGIGDLITDAKNAGGATGNAISGLLGGNFNTTGGDGKEYGFAFPLFKNPSEIFGLLLGRQAAIVTYDLPPFFMDFGWKQSFPIYGPLWGVVTASVGLKIDLAFGYDTQGITDFFNSGFSNPLALLSGLYIADTDKPEGGGVDVPELAFTGSIGVGAELNAGIASAGATANIVLEVDFDFYDPNHDDKIRIDELANTFLYEVRTGNPALAPLAIFDISGDVSLQLKAFIEFLFARFDFDITPPITLFEFSIPFEREPFLATERADGSLLLNIGGNASARMNGDVRDLSEQICVEYIGSNKAKVWSDSLGVPEGGAQIYTVNPDKGIFAYGGEGNDVIVVKGDIKVTADGGTGDDVIVVDGGGDVNLHGGLGNDTLVGGSGNDVIYGDLGDDIIYGRGGTDWIFGDGGFITEGDAGSVRAIAGPKDGNDVIWGGAGTDVVFGGGGNDNIAGDDGPFTGLSVTSIDVCGVTIDFGAGDAEDGDADFLFGDGGRIDAKGDGPGAAPDNTRLLLDRSTDGLRSLFAGITLTDRSGGGNDNIDGQGGDDVIFAGAGDDNVDGGVNDDTIYGETGLDVLSGGANDDEISGGVGRDTIFGFGAGPGDPYNDGGSTEDDGDDLLFGDDGNDLIRGNANSAADKGDIIYGGRGADVLFGDAGDDFIYGENEGDTIFGGAGSDYVEGGTGNDTVFGDDGLVIYFVGNEDDATDDRVIGDAFAFGGTDALFKYYDDDNTNPDNGDDDADLTLDLMVTYVRSGSDGNDTVIGGEGDDIAFGGAGDDHLYGDLDPVKWLADYASVEPPPVPAGTDTLIGDGGRIEWYGRRIDKIENFAGADESEAGDDWISGNGGPDRLFGGGGTDHIYGRMPESFAGNAKLDEDVGVDPGAEVSDNDIMLGDDGYIDYVRGTTTLLSIATSVNTPLAGETYDDYMYGNWGLDIMFGGLAGDVMAGDTGLQFSDPRGTGDIMFGDNGRIDFGLDDDGIATKITELYTTDTSETTGGADTMQGMEGADVILGGVNDGGVDYLYGDRTSPDSQSILDDSQDVILGDNGKLRFNVDSDLDTLDLITSERLGHGGVDQISGNAGGDVLIGSTDGDIMYGDDANASAGDVDGEDIMLGDNADITLIGTIGRLTVKVAAMTAGTAVDLIETTDTAESTGGADVMSGNAMADIMLGGVNDGGEDHMYGDRETPTTTTIANDGNDILLGDNGRLDFTFELDTDRNTLDLIRSDEDGRGGKDVISGNKGLDVAIGGTGGDEIYGDDDGASAAEHDLGDLLLGDNADVFLVNPQGASGGDIKIVLDAAVFLIRTTDEEHPGYGGSDTISGNADGDIIAGGVAGDTLYGDALSVVPELDGDDIILGDNGAFEWLSTGRLNDITGIDIEANNPDLYAKYHPGIADTDLTTLDLITTEQPTSGGRDTIYGDEGNDFAFGGTDLDWIHGDDGNEVAETAFANRDVLFGDHGRIYPQYPRFLLPNTTDEFEPADFPSRNFFAIDVGDTVSLLDTDGGEGDLMWGEEGDDVMLGQQGDDRMWGGSGDDDMIGGHNVSGGFDELTLPAVQATLNPSMNDLMDGGSGDDAMAGDNAIIWRRGDDVSPRFRTLTGEAIYTTGPDGVDTITTNVDGLAQSDPNDAVGRDIELLDHADTTPAGLYGADVMAGGADSDVMFGQLGDDLMQGDGNIGADDMDPNFITRHIGVNDTGMPDTGDDYYFNVPELGSDADDYMEGNGGDDLMYGGLGQDDMIGGSSNLFGLTLEEQRPDGSDIIYGGAGAPARLARNDFVGSTDTDHGTAEGVGAVPTDDDPSIALEDRHSRDADFIMGDNANIYRLVNGEDENSEAFLEFNYDKSSVYEDRGDVRIVVRAMEQLDYTLGGADYAGGAYVGGAAQPVDEPVDNGAADLIHGESGDDYIFGMTGSDVIFGESDDDDIVGGYGNDWISGGTGQDGVIGDDGLVYTSRNSTQGEPLYGIDALLASDANTKYNNGDALDELISTPGGTQIATINIAGQLKKTADLVPFSFDPHWLGMDDEFPDDATSKPYADDIIFGGLGSDFLHGGSGDDAISGAEALEKAYVPVFDDEGNPVGVLNLGYNAFDLMLPVNPGDSVANPNPGNVLAFNSVDLDGQHLNNRFRAGEFYLYDEYDPLRKIQLNSNGELWKPGDVDPNGDPLAPYEFLLNFDQTEGIFRDAGTVPKATGQQTDSYPAVNDDGKDSIFGDLANDWLVGGTGRDNLYGGWGNDLLNADDDLTTLGDAPKHGDPEVEGANDRPDTHPYYEDRAYGGAGRDILIGNTGGDRLIDWVGEYNSFLVPYAPFGQASVSRTLMPHLQEFLYALSAGDGADPTRYADAIGGDEPTPTNNNPIPSRNGEPHGELGLVLQKDFAWQDQTGAPADPQAGNIPGGKRDVLRSAGFNDGSMSGFAVDAGSFSVVNSKLSVAAASLGLDATAVLPLDDALPSYYEVLATVSVEKPTAGWKANSYIVFDYYDDQDFKFAGLNISTNEVEIGYRDAAGWHVVKDAPKQLKSGTYYNLMVAINGTNVTVVLDNKVALDYSFAPRVVDGYACDLNTGLVGLGSDNSRGTFDNFTVQRVPPDWTLQQSQDFASGTGTMFGGNESGTWTLSGDRYAAAAPGASLVDLGLPRGLETDAVLELSATLSTDGAGGFVFDRYAADDYKFIVIDAEAGQVILGHVSPKEGLALDASFAKAIGAGSDYTLTLRLKGTSASVSLGGQAVGGFVYNAVIVDGDFGLLAERGGSSFASAAVKTSDSAFYVPESAMVATAVAEESSGATLTLSELDAIAGFAISQWSDALGEDSEALAILSGASFGIADLGGAELGFTEGNTILIDSDAAGWGWYVDVSPASSSEFRVRLDSNVFGAAAGSLAYGYMDLVTVVEHEIGHLLGFEHGDTGAFPVMQEALAPGVRYALEPASVEPAAPAFDDFAGYAGIGFGAGIDWQAQTNGGWEVKLSPYDTGTPRGGASNFVSFEADLFAKPDAHKQGAEFDRMGRELLGQEA